MEPLVALSLAGSIVQFVQFATQLFNGARALHSSPGGSSVESSRLEDVYARLAALSHSMGTTPTRHSNNGPHTSEDDDMTRQLKVLAANCQEDCNKLLAIVQKLNVKTRSGPGWWNSFHVAFLEHSRSGDLKVLRQRINEHQSTITLLLCATSNDAIRNIRRQLLDLMALTQSARSRRSQEVRGIKQALDDLGKAVEDITPADITTGDGRKIGGSISSIKNLYTQTERMKAEQNILSSLHYNKRHCRHEAIPKAHQQTFSWVFTSQDDAHLGGGNLLNWLRKDSGIFWVSGKPGSGKSTFLKFVAEDPRTLTALKEWGDGKSVGLASHYFWAAGSSLQKSQEGLLRSILYEILEQLPSLIPKVIPGRWASAIDRTTLGLDPKNSARSWNLSDLELAINNVKSQLDVVDLPDKFCIFVDGLDEYTGDHAKLCQNLEQLAKTRNVKICVSSRPWNIFEEHIGSVASGRINMHELTRGDIYSYAQSQLASHATWAVLGRRNGTSETDKLVGQISDRAKGVFLWVFLVTKELREGMINYDTLSDLWRRLDSIPEDLEQFFKAILGSVEPFYHNKMAGTLQIALSANEPLEVEVYCFHDLEYEDGRYALSDKGGAWDEETWEEFKRPFPRRLNSRCKGLLEIHQGRVEFLHRTVSDFLRTNEPSKYVASRTRNGFNATLSIVQAYAAWLSHLDSSNESVMSALNAKFEECLGYARDAYEMDDVDDSFVHQLVDHIGDTFHSLSSRDSGALHQNYDRVKQKTTSSVFLKYILQEFLYKYLSVKLVADRMLLGKLRLLNPVVHVLGTPAHAYSDMNWRSGRVRMLELLLRIGIQPDAADPAYARFFMSSEIGNPVATSYEVISLFLDYVADPDVLRIWSELLAAGLSNKPNEGPQDAQVWAAYFVVLDQALFSLKLTSKMKSPASFASYQRKACEDITLCLENWSKGGDGNSSQKPITPQNMSSILHIVFSHLGWSSNAPDLTSLIKQRFSRDLSDPLLDAFRRARQPESQLALRPATDYHSPTPAPTGTRRGRGRGRGRGGSVAPQSNGSYTNNYRQGQGSNQGQTFPRTRGTNNYQQTGPGALGGRGRGRGYHLHGANSYGL